MCLKLESILYRLYNNYSIFYFFKLESSIIQPSLLRFNSYNYLQLRIIIQLSYLRPPHKHVNCNSGYTLIVVFRVRKFSSLSQISHRLSWLLHSYYNVQIIFLVLIQFSSCCPDIYFIRFLAQDKVNLSDEQLRRSNTKVQKILSACQTRNCCSYFGRWLFDLARSFQ